MSLTALAEAMLTRAKRIDAWLQDHGESSPSFDNDTLDALPEELQGERWALANSANDMKRLARGAETSMVDDALSVSCPLGRRGQPGCHSLPCDSGPTRWPFVLSITTSSRRLCLSKATRATPR